jgi:hypothetical protein
VDVVDDEPQLGARRRVGLDLADPARRRGDVDDVAALGVVELPAEYGSEERLRLAMSWTGNVK